MLRTRILADVKLHKNEMCAVNGSCFHASLQNLPSMLRCDTHHPDDHAFVSARVLDVAVPSVLLQCYKMHATMSCFVNRCKASWDWNTSMLRCDTHHPDDHAFVSACVRPSCGSAVQCYKMHAKMSSQIAVKLRGTGTLKLASRMSSCPTFSYSSCLF